MRLFINIKFLTEIYQNPQNKELIINKALEPVADLASQQSSADVTSDRAKVIDYMYNIIKELFSSELDKIGLEFDKIFVIKDGLLEHSLDTFLNPFFQRIKDVLSFNFQYFKKITKKDDEILFSQFEEFTLSDLQKSCLDRTYFKAGYLKGTDQKSNVGSLKAAKRILKGSVLGVYPGSVSLGEEAVRDINQCSHTERRKYYVEMDANIFPNVSKVILDPFNGLNDCKYFDFKDRLAAITSLIENEESNQSRCGYKYSDCLFPDEMSENEFLFLGGKVNALIAVNDAPQHTLHKQSEQYANSDLCSFILNEGAKKIMGFALVANRDIEPDEDILFDYGKNYPRDWDRFEDSTGASSGSGASPLTAVELNSAHAPIVATPPGSRIFDSATSSSTVVAQNIADVPIVATPPGSMSLDSDGSRSFDSASSSTTVAQNIADELMEPHGPIALGSGASSSSTAVAQNIADEPMEPHGPIALGSEAASPTSEELHLNVAGEPSGATPPSCLPPKKRKLAQIPEKPHWELSVEQQINSIKEQGCKNLSDISEAGINDILSKLTDDVDGQLWIPSQYSTVSFNRNDAIGYRTFELIAVGDKITIVPVISVGEISYTTEAICCTDIEHRDRNKFGYLITKPIESSQILTRHGEGFDCDEFKQSLTNCKSRSLDNVLTFIEKSPRSNDILGSIMNQLLQRFEDPNSKELYFRFRKTEILQIDRMLEFSSKQ